MLTIGRHQLKSRVLAAPMAGISDQPFRTVCRSFGAGLTTSEMTIIRDNLLNSYKSKSRLDFSNETAPISVQIAGSCVEDFVYSASYVADKGADIIDINMGCPAKKVCHKAAGSALLKDEALVARILKAVVASVDIPVTLKIRTGWDRQHKNALQIANIAEGEGIQMLVIHGRTREDKYRGNAEYDTIAQVVANTSIPVIANGDISCADTAQKVLNYTQAQGVMLGRGIHGKPWLIAEINEVLAHGRVKQHSLLAKKQLILRHIGEMYRFYGEGMGVRMARKHILWYISTISEDWQAFWQRVNQLPSADSQYQSLAGFLKTL